MAQALVARRGLRRKMPPHIAENAELDAAIAASLPWNYNFEVKKTLWKLSESEAKKVALQLPEGLLLYANALAELVRRFHECRVVVLGDVTFGACCVDDLAAKALECDFLVHYGHSCLVPSLVTGPLKSLYVFVEIDFDVEHFVGCVREQFAKDEKLALAGTVQFSSGVSRAREFLGAGVVPQELPLSGGEVLGCTSPKLDSDVAAIVFVADGRFHLESVMIRNPSVPAFKYDPYSKKLTRERYDYKKMIALRQSAIRRAATAQTIGVVLGTLGRQGSPKVLERIKILIREAGKKFFVLLASEVSLPTLKPFADHVQAWIQIACPRLSIDWGHSLAPQGAPVLAPYEAFLAFDTSRPQLRDDSVYPMDFYSAKGGPWSNYYRDDNRDDHA